GGVVTTSTPVVDYVWAFSQQNNFDRLVSMLYPVRPQGGTRRTISFDYGNNASDIDSSAGRVTRIYDSALGNLIADYDYAGISRRVGTLWGNGMTQSVADGNGAYTGLDR